MSDPHAELVRERGQAHEDERLAYFARATGGHYADLSVHGGWTVEEIARAAAATEDAMRDGIAADLPGDLLRRALAGANRLPASHRGAFAARRIRLRGARHEARAPGQAARRPPALPLQPAARGGPGLRAGACLRRSRERRGGAGRAAPIRALHRRTARRLERVVDGEPEPVYPEPVAHCGICQLDPECSARRRADDHLSLVAGATRDARAQARSRRHRDASRVSQAPQPTQTVADLPPERLRPAAQPGDAAGRIPHDAASRRAASCRRRASAATLACRSPRRATSSSTSKATRTSATTAASSTSGAGRPPTAIYHCRWAHTEAEEQAALCEFIRIRRGRARHTHPDLHVFHYAAHEKGKLALARVRSTACSRPWSTTGCAPTCSSTSTPSCARASRSARRATRSRQLERHHAFERKERAVREGGGSIIAYENWLETGDETLLEAIRAYNEEDCASTRVAASTGSSTRCGPRPRSQYSADFAELALPADEETYEPPEWLPAMLALVERLPTGCRPIAAEDDDEQAARRLLAGLLLYHYRESKPQFWALVRPQGEDGRRARRRARRPCGLVTLDRTRQADSLRTSRRLDVPLPAAGGHETLARRVRRPDDRARAHKLVRIEDDHLVLRRGKKADPPAPAALIGRAPPARRPDAQGHRASSPRACSRERTASTRLWRMLRREASAAPSGELGPEIDQLISATLGLDRSVLPVQGPPGHRQDLPRQRA